MWKDLLIELGCTVVTSSDVSGLRQVEDVAPANVPVYGPSVERVLIRLSVLVWIVVMHHVPLVRLERPRRMNEHPIAGVIHAPVRDFGEFLVVVPAVADPHAIAFLVADLEAVRYGTGSQGKEYDHSQRNSLHLQSPVLRSEV